MTTAHLPASTELLGLFVRTLDARRYADGSKACALRDRTSRRCFAGSVRTRHWCCPLTGLLAFLFGEGLMSPAADAGAAFLAFAAAILRWDAVTRESASSARAHLRVAAIELASIVRLLKLAGIEDAARQPTWIDFGGRAVPLNDLRRAAKSPSFRALSTKLGFTEHTIGRWFNKGERPSREALQALAKHFSENETARAVLYRTLYWHYALGDLMVGLSQWLPIADIRDIALVAASIARCTPVSLELGPLSALEIAALLPTVPAALGHAVFHGASPDWIVETAPVLEQYEAAGIGEHGTARAHVEFILGGLPKRKKRQVRRSS